MSLDEIEFKSRNGNMIKTVPHERYQLTLAVS